MAEASLRTRSTGGGLASDRLQAKTTPKRARSTVQDRKKSPERRVMTSMQNLVSQGGAVYFSTGFP